jgi:hypothetical protein
MDDALLVCVLDGLADRGLNNFSRSRGGKLLWSQYSVILSPRTSSMTK